MYVLFRANIVLLVAGFLSPPVFAEAPENNHHFQRQDKEEGRDGEFWKLISLEKGAKPPNQDETYIKAADNTCGYKACDLGKPGMLNVHLVPHTHDDVGWLKTVDQYYYGDLNNIQNAGVQYILDSVIEAIQENPQRRFIYVEIAFFYRWWRQQSDYKRHLVKGMVNKGQLQFILGGWCMNDEASTHYNAIIDQHTHGFRFITDNFGECGLPKIGWQIDPFGHSREQASLFAQFGFDGLFFGRLDYQDKDVRMRNKTAELMWFGSSNLGDAATLFTGVNYNGYSQPPGYCFECGDDPIMDDKRMHDYNVNKRVDDFIKYVKEQALNYTTNHIMLTMGSDFQYSNARINFKNTDKLMNYVNARQSSGSKVNTIYSTPACYLYALNQANQTYTSKSDDFFPYAHRPHAFWTGYFTSRAALKYYVRRTNNFFQVVKQLDAMANLEAEYGSDLLINELRDAMGVAQHHDAVSGTEKQAVAYDYALRLAAGNQGCEEVMNYAYERLLMKGPEAQKWPTQTFCTLTNISRCDATETAKQFTVLVYNPLVRPVSTWVRIPVAGKTYTIIDGDNKPIQGQMVPVSVETAAIPERNGSKATSDLIFKVDVPALGVNTLFVQQASGDSSTAYPSKAVPTNGDVVIENDLTSLTFDGTTGLLKGMTNKKKSLSVSMKQSLQYYRSFLGNNSVPDLQASGAYVFRPDGQSSIPTSPNAKITKITGAHVQEVRQVFNNWTSQVVRLYEGEQYAEFEWTIGPIPIADKHGREVISRFETDLNNQATFYTDANGREVLKRVRNYRPTWKLNQTEPVSGNYYPINSRIYMKDTSKNVQLTILTDRSQGGGSIKDGQLEIMVHRRTLGDDALGVGEPLNETGSDGKGLIIRGSHFVLLDTIESSGRLHRAMAEELFMAPINSFSPIDFSWSMYEKHFSTKWSGLSDKDLPANVHLLSLEGWRGPDILLRLEHFYEKDEDPELSKPVTVSLKDLFRTFQIKSVEELTLGANQKLQEAHRLQWNVQGYGKTKSAMADFVTPVDPATLEVELKPMQIRTFRVSIK